MFPQAFVYLVYLIIIFSVLGWFIWGIGEEERGCNSMRGYMGRALDNNGVGVSRCLELVHDRFFSFSLNPLLSRHRPCIPMEPTRPDGRVCHVQ